MEKLLQSLGTLLLAIFSMIFGAFVFTEIWRWFIVPLGMMQIGVWHAIGIRTFYHFLVLNPATINVNKNTNIQNVMITIFASLLMWGTSYITHLLMVAYS